MKAFFEIGKVVKTHGIKGDVKLQHWCDSPDIVADLSCLFFDPNGERRIDIERAKIYKDSIIVKFSGVNSIEGAQKLLNKTLYANRDDIELPIGRHFIQDLIGMDVYNFDNKDVCYGKVVEILQPGANDVYRVLSEDGVERLIPVIDDVVLRIALEDNSIYIRPLEGLFDDKY